MLFAILITVLSTIGLNESKNLQIVHIKNVTLDSCGLKPSSSEQSTHKHCFEWHNTILEERNALKRIQYGTDAEFKDFPYTVLFAGQTKEKRYGVCTAAIINQFWIITAAHCINTYSSGSILIGISNFTAKRNFTYVHTNRAIIHETYNASDDYFRYYDIGLLKLKTALNLEKFGANGVCLPVSQFSIDTNELATFSGYGYVNDFDTPKGQLKQTVIKLSSKYEMNEPSIETNQIIDGKPCESDSGGPLVQYVNGRAVLIGILKGTIGDKTKPCGPVTDISFSSVPFHVKWIIDKITNN